MSQNRQGTTSPRRKTNIPKKPAEDTSKQDGNENKIGAQKTQIDMPPVWKEQFFDIPKEKRENNKKPNS